MGGGVEDAQFVAHLPDERCRGLSVGRLYLDAKELAGTDRLDLLETRLVDEVPEYRLPLRVLRADPVRNDDADRKKTFAGRNP
jgi:hypothetical protein